MVYYTSNSSKEVLIPTELPSSMVPASADPFLSLENAINPSELLIAEIFTVVFIGRRVICILLLVHIRDNAPYSYLKHQGKNSNRRSLRNCSQSGVVCQVVRSLRRVGNHLLCLTLQNANVPIVGARRIWETLRTNTHIAVAKTFKRL